MRLREPPLRPDPATYSQEEVLAGGGIPTWDSPDIRTNHGGASGYSLLPESELDVRNLGSVSAVNALATLSTSPFGIGMPQTPLASHLFSINPGEMKTFKYPLPAAILSGDQSIGFFASIHHPHDSNTLNNNGAQAIKGVAVTKLLGIHEADIEVPVANITGAPRVTNLSVLPNNIGATVAPASMTVAPGQQLSATVHVDVSSGKILGEEQVTVVASDAAGNLVGGVTIYVLTI